MLKAARAVAVALAAGSTSLLALAPPADAQGEYYLPSANPPGGAENVPPPSSAAANVGPQLGARVGYAFGSGVIHQGLSIMDGLYGAMPLIGDLGWRFLPQLYAGLYGQYAPVFTKTNDIECFQGFTCATQDYRFGLEVDYHPAPRTRFDPYMGLAGGYEILHTHVSGPTVAPKPGGFVPANVDASVVDRGWEFASLVLGFDGRIDPGVGVGLFVQATLAEYNVHTGTQTVSVGGATLASNSVPDVNHGLHELYLFGVRATFNP